MSFNIRAFAQKKLGIDMEYVLKNGGIITGSHLIGTGCGFLVTLLLANFVDSTIYGQYKYAISVAGILGAFSLTGAAGAILQSVSKGYDGSFVHERRRAALWGLFSVILSCGVGIYYLSQGDKMLGWSVILMGTIGYMQSVFILHTAFLNGKKDFSRLARNQILSSVTILTGVGVAMYFHLTSVLWIIVAYHGSQLVFQIISSRNTLKAYTPNTSVNRDEKNLSTHLSIGNVTTGISEYLDKILIFQLLGPYQLAMYAFAVGIPDQVRSINKLINTITVPKLNAKDVASLHASITTHTKTYFLFTIILTCLFWLTAKPIYQLLFPQYLESAYYASIYMIILPIVASGMLYGHALQIKNKITSLYSARLIDSITKIVLFLVLIPHFGVLGAILAILISKALTMLTQIAFYVYSRKEG